MDDDGTLHKPFVGRVALAGMLLGMRIVNHLPPVKRRMAEGMLGYRGAERETEDESRNMETRQQLMANCQ